MRTSALGPDFPRERFLCTPISVIRRVLRELEQREQGDANLRALPTARLTTVLIQLAHDFSGSKRPAPKIEIKDFLPYPDWRAQAQEADGPDPPTKFILTELARKRLLPVHVMAALMSTADKQP